MSNKPDSTAAEQLHWYTKEDVLEMLNTLLQHPDVLIDAATVENSQYDEHELFALGMKGYHALSVTEFATIESQIFAEWVSPWIFMGDGKWKTLVYTNIWKYATTAELYEEFKRYKEGKG